MGNGMSIQSKNSLHKAYHHEVTEDVGSVRDYMSLQRQQYHQKYRIQNIGRTSHLQYKKSEQKFNKYF